MRRRTREEWREDFPEITEEQLDQMFCEHDWGDWEPFFFQSVCIRGALRRCKSCRLTEGRHGC